MLDKIRKFMRVVSLGILISSQSGCFALVVGAAAGAGGYAYMQGDVEKNLDESLKAVHKASVSGLKDLKMFIVKDELKFDSAVIKAQNADGKDVTVFIKALTEKASKINIRAGVFGDDTESMKILNAIQHRL